jgi:hypothetical protein
MKFDPSQVFHDMKEDYTNDHRGEYQFQTPEIGEELLVDDNIISCSPPLLEEKSKVNTQDQA